MMNEYRITWAFTPMRQNPTRVNFIEAEDQLKAKAMLIDKIERSEGQTLGFYTCDVVKPKAVEPGA